MVLEKELRVLHLDLKTTRKRLSKLVYTVTHFLQQEEIGHAYFNKATPPNTAILHKTSMLEPPQSHAMFR